MNEQRNDRPQPPSCIPLLPATPVLRAQLSGSVFTAENFTTEPTPSIMAWMHTYPRLCFLIAELQKAGRLLKEVSILGPNRRVGDSVGRDS